MANFTTQSLIGAAFDTPGSTADFTLLTKANGNNDSEWVYVIMTGTATTGNLVAINNAGTARLAGGTLFLATFTAVEFGFAQTTILQGQYGWVAKRGNNMYVSASGTISADTVYIAQTSGWISNVAISGTLLGVQVLAGVSSTAVNGNVCTAVLTYPRSGSGVI